MPIPAAVNLEAEFRGDTILYNLTLSRSGASAGWMTGGSIRFAAKVSKADADIDAYFLESTTIGGITWVDQGGATPTAILEISPADYPVELATLTEDTTLYYDIQITDADGRVETVQHGTLTITPDVVKTSP